MVSPGKGRLKEQRSSSLKVGLREREVSVSGQCRLEKCVCPFRRRAITQNYSSHSWPIMCGDRDNDV